MSCETSLKRLKFSKCLIEDRCGDDVRLLRRCVNEAGGGDGVDLSWDPGGELVDQVFDV